MKLQPHILSDDARQDIIFKALQTQTKKLNRSMFTPSIKTMTKHTRAGHPAELLREVYR